MAYDNQINPSPDAFVEVETANRLIDGVMLDCVDGRYRAGKEKTPFVSGNPLLVRGMVRVLQRFIDKKPQTIWPTEDGQLPNHNALNSAIPQSEWKIDQEGKPRPPWQPACVVYLLDEEAFESFTFISATWGGRKAYDALWNRVMLARDKSPEAQPIIELSDAPMNTPKGVKRRPHFKVVGWKNRIDRDPEMTTTTEGHPVRTLTKLGREGSDDLDEPDHDDVDVYTGKPVKRVPRVAGK